MFPISYWGELPEYLQIGVVTAKHLTIGGESAESWFGVNAMSRARADIAESSLNPRRVSRAKHAPDNKEVPTTIEEDGRFAVRVRVSEPFYQQTSKVGTMSLPLTIRNHKPSVAANICFKSWLPTTTTTAATTTTLL